MQWSCYIATSKVLQNFIRKISYENKLLLMYVDCRQIEKSIAIRNMVIEIGHSVQGGVRCLIILNAKIDASNGNNK